MLPGMAQCGGGDATLLGDMGAKHNATNDCVLVLRVCYLVLRVLCCVLCVCAALSAYKETTSFMCCDKALFIKDRKTSSRSFEIDERSRSTPIYIDVRSSKSR